MTHGGDLVIRGNKSTDQQSCARPNRLLTSRRWPCRIKKKIIGIQPDTYSLVVHLSNQDPQIHRSYGSDPGPDLDVTILVWVMIHTMASPWMQDGNTAVLCLCTYTQWYNTRALTIHISCMLCPSCSMCLYSPPSVCISSPHALWVMTHETSWMMDPSIS